MVTKYFCDDCGKEILREEGEVLENRPRRDCFIICQTCYEKFKKSLKHQK